MSNSSKEEKVWINVSAVRIKCNDCGESYKTTNESTVKCALCKSRNAVIIEKDLNINVEMTRLEAGLYEEKGDSRENNEN